MKTYTIQHLHEPQRYWNRELQDWRGDRTHATVYTESERVKSLVLQVRGEQGFLPASGCWVLVDTEEREREREKQLRVALRTIAITKLSGSAARSYAREKLLDVYGLPEVERLEKLARGEDVQ